MTIFMVRDARANETKFRRVRRETYKKMITVHDKAGEPVRVGTEYVNGNPVKKLTLMTYEPQHATQ